MLRELKKLLSKLVKLAKKPGIVFIEDDDDSGVHRECNIVVRQETIPRARRRRATVPQHWVIRPKRKRRAKAIPKAMVYQDGW